MLPEQQDRLAVVLVRARNPANIGAVARAMHDLGYTDLRIVNEYPVPFAAAKSAVDASSVLAAAREHTSLAEALADCTLVLGTTAVGERVLEHPLHTLAEATSLVQINLASSPASKVALLFGSEKTGLSNDELSHCHGLLTIPMNTRNASRHLSMNLGQAAAVCLYTLAQPTPEPRPPGSVGLQPHDSTDGSATSAAEERLTELLLEVLTRSGYVRRHPANTREPVIRRLVHRMANSQTDAAVWSGILRQILHTLP